MWECKHCKNIFDFITVSKKANHSRWCDKNPKLFFYKEEAKTKWLKVLQKGKEKNGYVNQFAKAKLLGLPKPNSNNGRKGVIGVYKHTDETKEKLRQAQLKSIANGKVIKAGRCKKFIHISPIAGTISVDGTWELRFCQWADKKGLEYQRNKIGFKYINLKGKEASYFPDFLVNKKTFVEIKGFETELDKCKWSQFTMPLIIIKKKELENLDSLFS
jgi:hypothetical protein